MDGNITILVATAFSVGLLHTLIGPDHYVPFVAISKCNGWSLRKTVWVTTICGLGHVSGSILIGSIGLLLGTAVFHLEAFEAFRGEGAAWLLIAFGLTYFTWAIVQAFRDSPHSHRHIHADGTVHTHLHQHDADHIHVHDVCEVDSMDDRPRRSITPWLMFVIFVFGPCEALIPLLMYPAAEANLVAVVLVVVAFTLATLGAMLASVLLLTVGLKFVRLPDFHRFGHASAAIAILGCGVLMKVGF